MAKGWIKLHRQLLDSAIWNVDSPYSERDAWIEFLLMANHSPKQIITRRCECIEIQRSQFFTSIRHLADRFKWSEKRVRRYLDTLTTAHMVRVERHTDGTLITIENYSNFQGEGHTDGTLDGHTDDHADDHAGVTRTRMYKNDKQYQERARARTDRFNNSSERKMDMGDLERLILDTQ